jgi:hypothetical protein
MGYGLSRFATLSGRRSSSADPLRCMSAGRRTASHRFTRSGAMRSGHYGSCVGNSRIAASCSRPSAVAHLRRMPSIGLSSASVSVPAYRSRFTPTCSDMRVATPWPTRATIRGRSRIGLGIDRSSTRCATPSCRRRGSRISGGSESCEPRAAHRCAATIKTIMAIPPSELSTVGH